MTIATTEPTREIVPDTHVLTLADLLENLAVSPERVLLFPHPGTADEADLLYANEKLGKMCELIDGTLVEMPMGSPESLLASFISSLLWAFVRPRKLGLVIGADSLFRLFGGSIRMPDVAFVPKDRFPAGLPSQPIWDISPSLAIEVLSVGNTAAEMKRKRSEYFSSSVQLVWIIDPLARTVTVYTSPEGFTLKQGTDELDGGSALPGFSVSLPEIFSVLDL